MGEWFTTRESVKGALDIKESAYNNTQVDACIETASREAEGALHRFFYPFEGTRYFSTESNPSVIDFGPHSLVSASAVTVDGTALGVDGYYLEPANSAPPYEWIEASDDAGTSFSSEQRGNAITGVWAYTDIQSPVGVTTASLDGSQTAVRVSGAASAAIGVGSLLKIDSERMIVVGRSSVDTTQNVGGSGLTNNKNSVVLAVSDGTAFGIGETLLVDAEKVRVDDIAGNNLIVTRAVEGTVLAAHAAGVDIYAPRSLTVVRASAGTSAASHNDASTVRVWQVPGLLEEYTTAVALVMLGQRQAGYALTMGKGENARESTGRGLAQIRKEAIARYGRVARRSAV